MTWPMLLDGNKHFNDSGSYIGIQMENIVFSRINTTPGFASLISFMATKVGVIVVGLLWWRAGSHVLVPKVCLLQMKVGILIMFSTTFFLGNTWCLKYIDALFHLQSQLLNLRHSLTTRFLLTCISSYFFDGENTLDDLHEVMAADATFLYEKGITAPLKNDLLLIFIIWPLHFQGSLWACLTLNQTKKKCSPCLFHRVPPPEVGSVHLRLVCVGTKGDWVFLRKDACWKFNHIVVNPC